MRAFLCLAFLSALSCGASARDLVIGFQKALTADPAYQAAKAEFEVNKIGAERAGRAYWPEFGFRAGERTEITGFQTTVQVAQPLMDAERLATWRSAEPLETRAAATMRQREVELLQRYYKAVMDLVRAREQLSLNRAKTELLEQQAVAARRALELGTGTKTDVYDTTVRLSLAKAEALTLRANAEAAERQYRSQTNEAPPARAFLLARERRPLGLPTLDTLLREAESLNPQVINAVQGERLAELDVSRRYGAFLPRINAVARQTRVQGGQNVDYIGLAFELPLQSGSFLDVAAAKASLAKALEDTRTARVRVALDVQRYYELVANGREEVPIRLAAIEAARLGLEASEKSFKGGVRSQVDVLNSIQTLFQTNDDFVAAMLNLGMNYVALHALVDSRSTEVLAKLEELLF